MIIKNNGNDDDADDGDDDWIVDHFLFSLLLTYFITFHNIHNISSHFITSVRFMGYMGREKGLQPVGREKGHVSRALR